MALIAAEQPHLARPACPICHLIPGSSEANLVRIVYDGFELYSQQDCALAWAKLSDRDKRVAVHHARTSQNGNGLGPRR